MLKTASEIAKIKGVNRAAVSIYISKNNIKPAGKKGERDTYDTEKEPLKGYIENVRAKPQISEIHDPITDTQEIPADDEDNTQAQVMTPLNYLTAKIAKPGQRPADLYYAKALKLAEKNQDAALYFKLAQMAAKENADNMVRLQMIKTEAAKEQIAVEKAKRLILENDIRRGEFMEKDMVKLFLGRVYSVHTSVLQPLDLKISDAIEAVLKDHGLAGDGWRGKTSQIIRDEIFAALKSIQRLLIDFVEVGEGIDETGDKV